MEQPPSSTAGSDEPVTWRSLPRKSQLAILGSGRLVDFLQVSSLQAYLFFQLKSFDATASDSTVSWQAGMLLGSFTAAQFATAVFWGKMADADWCGRKPVLLAALVGTAVSCVAFGFSKSFLQAIVIRTLGGAMNGGNVCVIRTMIAENIKDKRFQSRAFLILPLSFNIASLVGPVFGGFLSNPVANYPQIFGTASLLGGATGVRWMIRFPYALPSLLSALLLLVVAVIVSLGLIETHDTARRRRYGAMQFLRRYLSSGLIDQTRYSTMDSDDRNYAEVEETKRLRKIPFRRIWTSNLLLTLLSLAIFDFHMGAFNNLWPLFLSTPRAELSDDSKLNQGLDQFFAFTGGLGLLPQNVGMATAIIGVIGITIQLAIYPKVHQRLGTVKCFRLFYPFFPIAYALTPYLSIVPSSSPPPSQSTGPLVWISITVTLLFQVTARTFTLPATIILLSNCAPHASVLGTVNGIGQAVSSAFRALGPAISSYLYGIGLSNQVIGTAWWGVSVVAIFGCVTARWIRERPRHEMLLPDEIDERS